jgi:hypothetical protein
MARRPKLAAPEPEVISFAQAAQELAEGLSMAKKLATQMNLTYDIPALLAFHDTFIDLEPGTVDQFYVDFALARRVVSDSLDQPETEPQKLHDVVDVYRTANGDDAEEEPYED